MDSGVDFKDDILAYLRRHHGQLVTMMTMVGELTCRVKRRTDSRRLRGRIMTDLSSLVVEGKVIRYRRTTMARLPPASSQGFLRISELAV